MSKKLFGDRVVDDFLPWLENRFGNSWLNVPVSLLLLSTLPAFVVYTLAVKGGVRK